MLVGSAFISPPSWRWRSQTGPPRFTSSRRKYIPQKCKNETTWPDLWKARRSLRDQKQGRGIALPGHHLQLTADGEDNLHQESPVFALLSSTAPRPEVHLPARFPKKSADWSLRDPSNRQTNMALTSDLATPTFHHLQRLPSGPSVHKCSC